MFIFITNETAVLMNTPEEQKSMVYNDIIYSIIIFLIFLIYVCTDHVWYFLRIIMIFFQSDNQLSKFYSTIYHQRLSTTYDLERIIFNAFKEKHKDIEDLGDAYSYVLNKLDPITAQISHKLKIFTAISNLWNTDKIFQKKLFAICKVFKPNAVFDQDSSKIKDFIINKLSCEKCQTGSYAVCFSKDKDENCNTCEESRVLCLCQNNVMFLLAIYNKQYLYMALWEIIRDYIYTHYSYNVYKLCEERFETLMKQPMTEQIVSIEDPEELYLGYASDRQYYVLHYITQLIDHFVTPASVTRIYLKIFCQIILFILLILNYNMFIYEWSDIVILICSIWCLMSFGYDIYYLYNIYIIISTISESFLPILNIKYDNTSYSTIYSYISDNPYPYDPVYGIMYAYRSPNTYKSKFSYLYNLQTILKIHPRTTIVIVITLIILLQLIHKYKIIRQCFVIVILLLTICSIFIILCMCSNDILRNLRSWRNTYVPPKYNHQFMLMGNE
jgi:hypothetical protein